MQVCYLIGGVREMIETTVERTGEVTPVRLCATICGTLCDTDFVDRMEFAVRELRRALPQGVEILCCQSCVHGNFCPTGDLEDEIFCMADVMFRTIQDVWRITEDEAEREKRARRLLFFCDRYRAFGDAPYAYNDWNNA